MTFSLLEPPVFLIRFQMLILIEKIECKNRLTALENKNTNQREGARPAASEL